jgi:hypothetical protein
VREVGSLIWKLDLGGGWEKCEKGVIHYATERSQFAYLNPCGVIMCGGASGTDCHSAG